MTRPEHVIWMRRLDRAAEGLDHSDLVYLADLVKSMPDAQLRPHLVNRSTAQIRAWLDSLLESAAGSGRGGPT